MPAQEQNVKLLAFYRTLFLHFVGALRSLTLYPAEHPEIEKKVASLYQGLSRYLERRSNLTFIFVRGEVVVGNAPLPDLSGNLAQLIERFQTIGLQRLDFRRGLTSEELLRFLQVMLGLLKNPEKADVTHAMSQQNLAHVNAGGLGFDAGAQLSYDEVSKVLEDARQAVLSLSGQLKDLFGNLEVPLADARISMARDRVTTIYGMVASGDVSLKLIIQRRSPEPDPYVHAVNVSALAMALARQLNLEESVVLDVGLGALLHDIGFHLLPEAAPGNSATVTLDERNRHWEHPVRGAEALLATQGLPDIVPLIAYEHHIHYDGGGYPQQERPRELNLASLITSIADSYDNLRRKHLGRPAFSLQEAILWMDRRAGSRFHPVLHKRFRTLLKAEGRKSS
jgi:putative nucleotidyltransferase with HDIG domain